MNDIKQTNFRVSSASANAFRAFCEEQGINQAQGFEHLLEIMALDKAKTAIQTREKEITNFEQHAKALISAYLHSLELNENAEARIKEQFETELKSQSQTIMEYQQQISEQKKQLVEAVKLTENFQEDLAAIQESIETEIEKRHRAETDFATLKEEKETQLADKNNIITMLTSKLTTAEQKANEYDALKKHTEALQAKLSAAEQMVRDNAKDAEIAQERAVRAVEKSLEGEYKKELDRLRSQNTELLQTIAGIEKTSAEQIRATERENATLREKLALLKKDFKES